jgi:DNA-binding transcriptional LysR family regulator
MTLELRLLITFESVARLGSIGAASREMGVPQPTVSRQLRALEQQFGQQLCDRDKRGAHLTPAGRELLPRARLIIHEIGEARKALNATSGLNTGTLRVGAVPSIARSFLCDAIAKMAERAPLLKIEVFVASEDELEIALTQRQIDVGLFGEDLKSADTVPIGSTTITDRCVPVCATTHPILQSSCIDPAIVLQQRWAMPHPGAKTRRQFSQLVQACDEPFPIVALQTESVDLMLSVIARSQILGWVPEPIVAALGYRHLIAKLDIPDLSLRRKFRLHRRARGTFPKAGQMLLDVLGEIEMPK